MQMADNVIEVENLTKKFGDFTAVDHISFEVHRGEIFGFLGANGAGKTTAMKMLTGLSFPTSGKGTVAGYDIWTQSELIKKHIGYMSQKFALYSDIRCAEKGNPSQGGRTDGKARPRGREKRKGQGASAGMEAETCISGVDHPPPGDHFP